MTSRCSHPTGIARCSAASAASSPTQADAAIPARSAAARTAASSPSVNRTVIVFARWCSPGDRRLPPLGYAGSMVIPFSPPPRA